MPFFSDLHFPAWAWVALLSGALAIGMSKGGLAGMGILPVVCFAMALPPRASTGFVLPLLIVGDICAVYLYRRVVVWKVFWRLLPPALAGVVLGYFCMGHISAAAFGPLIGGIVLALVVLQLLRGAFGARFDHIFDSHGFGLFMGLLAGFTTMIANAAGPVAVLYFLSIRLPKWNLIGTMAWFFFITNLFKVPFSAHLGLINGFSFDLSFLLAPLVVGGFFLGRFLAGKMPQKVFEIFLLICTALGALRLIF
jgi:uncharacterized membrane protein YfcA